MPSESALQLASFSPSVGWVIDRSGDKEEIIGSVWLAADGMAATCAYIFLPYADIIEALLVRFPQSNRVFSVTGAKFHPGFDQWAAKRLLSQSDFYPPPLLVSLENNLVFLELSEDVFRLSPAVVSKIDQLMASQERSEFAGKVSNIELAGIMQSLLSHRQTGTLVVSDSHKRTFARLFCDNGQIKYVRFKDSYNEQAMYRLVSTPFQGYFFFKFEEKPQWCDFEPMERATNPVMIEAYMRLDAQTSLKANISGPDMLVRKIRDQLDLSVFDVSEHADVSYVWDHIQLGTTIGRLMIGCSLDGYIVLHSLEILLQAGFIQVIDGVSAGTEFKSANLWTNVLDSAPLIPLLTTTDASLSEGDAICCLSIDSHSVRPVIEEGVVLDARREGDNYHNFISINVPSESVGAPIFKDSVVVGMHCGQIARDVQQTTQAPMSDYMLKIDSIESLIAELTGKRRKVSGTATLVDRDLPNIIDSVDEQSVTLTNLRKVADGQNDRTNSGTASSDKVDPVRSLDGGVNSINKVPAPPTNRFGALFNSVSSVFQPFQKIEEPTNEWFNVDCIRAKYGSIKWQKTSVNTQFIGGDVLRLEVRIEQDMHFYVAYQRAGGRGVHLLAPDVEEQDLLLKTGTVFEVPRKNTEKSSSGRNTSSKNQLVGLTLSGTAGQPDSILFLSSPKVIEEFHDQAVRTEMFHKALALLVVEKNLVPHSILLSDLLPSPFATDGTPAQAVTAEYLMPENIGELVIPDKTSIRIAKLQISCKQ